jgi:hypothetical protein
MLPHRSAMRQPANVFAEFHQQEYTQNLAPP